MKAKRNNQKGVAIEMAIVTLLVIFALCSILLTVTELGVAHNRTIVESVYSRADVNRIADEFAILVRGGGIVSAEASVCTICFNSFFSDHS